jgi:hypothetical protein
MVEVQLHICIVAFSLGVCAHGRIYHLTCCYCALPRWMLCLRLGSVRTCHHHALPEYALTQNLVVLQHDEVLTALIGLFHALEQRMSSQHAAGASPHAGVVDPTDLRVALSKLPGGKFIVGRPTQPLRCAPNTRALQLLIST